MKKHKIFWACDACDKFYTVEHWGWKHVVAVHDGAAWLEEFSPERQAEIIANQNVADPVTGSYESNGSN